MTNILRSLSFSITQLVYPLIKTLYEMFYDIAKTEFFSVDEIRQLSGNIYIVISVCMLFALGLKLIGAIVNPELLTDQKKGVKSVAMHSIFAVFLIILLPMGFTKIYEFQGDIIENQLVEKIVLGADVSDDSSPGQILAAYAFYSFCQPNETISIESISNSGGDLYNKAISEDISLIKDMDGIINSKTDGKYDIEYHAILSPGVGIFLCYEMVLLCMDIALRTIKLGLLQLLTPLILCGYVVKGSEILQKWAKEVGTTYVLLFLKVGMVSFMIYGLSVLPGFLDKLPSTSHGLWYFSLIRVFVIIGLLQLIKQLPDIINTIFGTNIKFRGGVKGRLGEMAAVGSLAQKGWDALKGAGASVAGRALASSAGVIKKGLNNARTGYIDNYKGKKIGEKIKTLGQRSLGHVGNVGRTLAKTPANIANAAKHPFRTLGKGLNATMGAATDILKTTAQAAGAGLKAGNAGAGLKAGREMSGVKTSAAMRNDDLTSAQSRHARAQGGLDLKTGKLTSKTRDDMTHGKVTADELVDRIINGESSYMNKDQAKVTGINGRAQGKLTEIGKAEDAKNSMASILSQIGNSLSMTGDEKQKDLGSQLSGLATSITDKNGSGFDLRDIMGQISTLSSSKKVNLNENFQEALKTLQNGQDNFNNAAHSLEVNFGISAADISDSKSLNSKKTTAEIEAKTAEGLYNEVFEASSATEKASMKRATTAIGTEFGMIPEYEQASRHDSGGTGGAYLDNGNWVVEDTVPQYNYAPTPGSSTGSPAPAPSSPDSGSSTPAPSSPDSGSPAPAPSSPDSGSPAPAPSSSDSGSSTPAPSSSDSESSTPAPSSSDLGGSTGPVTITVSGPVSAEVDLSGISEELKEINNNIGKGNTATVDTINEQGKTIASQIDKNTATTKNMNESINELNDNQSNDEE